LQQHCKNADCNEHLLATIKESLFSDFDGIIKSLGAWGGDFVMAGTILLNILLPKDMKLL
jgi:hypothetical protein